jgi:hypothetical protein
MTIHVDPSINNEALNYIMEDIMKDNVIQTYMSHKGRSFLEFKNFP